MYSIVLGSSTQELVTMMYDVRVKSDVLSMAFVKDNATHYAPFPLALAIGEKNGTVSLFLTDGEKNQFKSTNKMRKLFTQQSAVLTLAFGFVEDGIMIASGTKDGVISVYAIVFHEEEWKLSHLLCEHTRTGAIRALRFNHDSTSLIVGGYDNTLLIIDTHLWKTVEEVPVDGTVSFALFESLCLCSIISFFFDYAAIVSEHESFLKSYRYVPLNTIHIIDTYFSEVDQRR